MSQKATGRWSATALTAILAAGLTLHPVSSSARAVGADLAELRAVDYSGAMSPVGVSCPVTQPSGADQDLDLPINGGWRTLRMERSGGAIDSSQTSGGTVVTARVVDNRRGVTHLNLVSTAVARVTPLWASANCSPHYTTVGSAGVRVVVARRSWMVARSTAAATSGPLDGSVRGYNADDSFYAKVAPGHGFTRLVAPDTYAMYGELEARAYAPAGTTAAQVTSVRMTANLSIIPIGTRRTHSGSGLAYITAGHRDCANSRVTMRFTNAARSKARKITFYVNGQRRIVLRGRQVQRSSLLLTRIAPSSAGTVRAEVVLRSGARRAMQSTSWPCA